MPARDAADLLALVERREAVLRDVGPDPRRKCDLADSVSVSRSTVNRAVRELADAGFLEYADGGYRRTLAGRLVLDAYDRFADRAEGVVAAEGVLDGIDPDSEFAGAVLDGATVVEGTETSPHRPLSHLGDVVGRARHVEAFAPAVFPTQVETYHRRIVDAGMTARVLVAEGVMERLGSTYRTETTEALATGRAEIRWCEDLPPYSLTVAETGDGPEIGLLTYGNNGVVGFLGNDSAEAVEWAREALSRRWEAGRPLRVPVPED